MDYEKLDKIKVTINGKEYELMVASSEEEKEYGLMGVSELGDNEGMWFCYKDDPQEELSYWMKNTSIPLDIIFVSEDMEVLDVLKGEPESEELLTCTAPEDTKIVAVIELNQDSGIQKGDEIEVDGDNTFSDLPENGMFVLNPDGTVQFTLKGGERIFSRISSRVIIRKAKKALASKSDTDYKALGRYIFKELDAQERRPNQYVESPSKKD